MNGLEAIELMKQGKIVTDGKREYQISDGKITVLTYVVRNDMGTGRELWENVEYFNTAKDSYEEYIEPKPLTGWERVEGDSYETITSNGALNAVDFGYYMDVERYKQANYFSTKEKAEEIIFKQTLFRKLQRFSDENGGNEIDRNNEIKMKWGIWYNHEYEELASCPYVYGQAFGQVYFISEEVAEKAIELFRDELIKYFTHDWSGKDETPINLNSEER
ncbi:hypothetical protein [Turicibacter sanguinis]|uniref:hypothetical protein n=1 Tax=Turicibacter sanguinis TaxID=154288 RepID=UPI0021D50271|nr:hypothetical protein [Turicibacter sanguinis]MCU7192266.1 hypothetical protein [Turicibacter sanguinis]